MTVLAFVAAAVATIGAPVWLGIILKTVEDVYSVLNQPIDDWVSRRWEPRGGRR